MEETINDYMKKLEILKKDYERAMLEAARKMTLEQGKIQAMQETISEKNNKIATLSVEINSLLKTLEEVNESRMHLESSLREAKAKIDSVEKTNSSLRYELCMVQKEVEIRTQEREFDHKSATAAHKQHLESVKKIAKLEAECQRLRVLVKKRLPGPAALAKMKTEVETLGFQSNSNTSNKINHNNMSLLERLSAIEEENKVLKDALVRKNGELQATRTINPRARAHSRASSLDVKIEEDNTSCAESGSWASALVAELDNFKAPQHTSVASCKSPTVLSELSLLDDFVEMEKLALEDAKTCITTKEEESKPEKDIVHKSVMRVVEFLEGIIEKSVEQKYIARAFLWESKGLKGVLRNFIHVCNDFINERAKVEKFVTEFGVTLDWVVNHCFSLQDVSEMREAIVKDFGGGEPNSWNGLENLLNSPRHKSNHTNLFSKIDVHKPLHHIETGDLIKDNSEKKKLEGKEKHDTDFKLVESASNSKQNVKVSRELKFLLEEDQVSNGDCNKHTLSNEVDIQEAMTTEATPSLEL
jgi:Filament-like plant protein, long coiled-coil